jgi:diguanylate cyclase (GGDEF)-like protein
MTSILLIGPESKAVELRRIRGQNGFAHSSDPYKALELMAGGPFDSILLAEELPDFAHLVRACRRLSPRGRVLGLCSPAGEARLRGLEGAELDDYVIYPPTAQELEEAMTPPEEGPADAAAAAIPTSDMVALLEATTTMQALMDCLARIVTQWTGQEVGWREFGAKHRGAPLLLLDGDMPRMLLSSRPRLLRPAMQRRLENLQSLLAPLAEQVRRIESLHRLAITDHLTGAYNRRYFYHFTDQLIARAKAEKFRVTLLLFDIDNFKRYNDNYGHATGDEILREISKLLKQVTRENDIVARLGGDEFAVLFWDAEAPRRPDSQHPGSAAALTQRFMQALSRHEFACLGPSASGTLTVSGGLATFPWDGQDVKELLRHADQGLREVKKSGKNSIYVIGQPDERT